MSKYEKLWNYIEENGTQSFSLTFDEIAQIAGVPLDHSFLTYKKKLEEFCLESRENLDEKQERFV